MWTVSSVLIAADERTDVYLLTGTGDGGVVSVAVSCTASGLE